MTVRGFVVLSIGLVSTGGKAANGGLLSMFGTTVEACGQNLSASIDQSRKVVELGGGSPRDARGHLSHVANDRRPHGRMGWYPFFVEK